MDGTCVPPDLEWDAVLTVPHCTRGDLSRWAAGLWSYSGSLWNGDLITIMATRSAMMYKYEEAGIGDQNRERED